VGRTLPVKVRFTDCAGKPIPDLEVRIRVERIVNGQGDTKVVPLKCSKGPKQGDLFHYVPWNEQYIYVLHTCAFKPGTYRITATPEGGVGHSVEVSFVKWRRGWRPYRH
jgi:hypothetical protein